MAISDDSSARPIRSPWPFFGLALGLMGIFLGATMALLALGGGR